MGFDAVQTPFRAWEVTRDAAFIIAGLLLASSICELDREIPW